MPVLRTSDCSPDRSPEMGDAAAGEPVARRRGHSLQKTTQTQRQITEAALAVFVALWLFFTRTLTGKAILATSNNRLAAQLVGINTNWVMTLSFALSAAIGALAGVLVTPITLISYDVGIALALKGFAAAMLGGMGNPKGALVGGILLGLFEALTAGYLSSQYKDAAAFIVILAVLFAMPQGLFGKKSTDRV